VPRGAGYTFEETALSYDRTNAAVCAGYQLKLTECHPAFTGDRCEINLDDCADQLCSGQGLCIDGTRGGFTCFCDVGFVGPTCDTPTDVKMALQCPRGAIGHPYGGGASSVGRLGPFTLMWVRLLRCGLRMDESMRLAASSMAVQRLMGNGCRNTTASIALKKWAAFSKKGEILVFVRTANTCKMSAKHNARVH
jgi:hypothetical protein